VTIITDEGESNEKTSYDEKQEKFTSFVGKYIPP
jgi:hypothetical protein